MQLLGSLSLFQAGILAVTLGVCFALSVRKQMLLQQRDIEIDRAGGKTSFLERLSHLGLSLAIALVAVLISKYVISLPGYDFLQMFLCGVFATWVTIYLSRLWQRRKNGGH